MTPFLPAQPRPVKICRLKWLVASYGTRRLRALGSQFSSNEEHPQPGPENDRLLKPRRQLALPRVRECQNGAFVRETQLADAACFRRAHARPKADCKQFRGDQRRAHSEASRIGEPKSGSHAAERLGGSHAASPAPAGTALDSSIARLQQPIGRLQASRYRAGDSRDD